MLLLRSFDSHMVGILFGARILPLRYPYRDASVGRKGFLKCNLCLVNSSAISHLFILTISWSILKLLSCIKLQSSHTLIAHPTLFLVPHNPILVSLISFPSALCFILLFNRSPRSPSPFYRRLYKRKSRKECMWLTS